MHPGIDQPLQQRQGRRGRPVTKRVRPALWLLALMAIVPALVGAAPAVARVRLVMGHGEVPGYKAAGGGERVAHSLLGHRVPRALRHSRPQGAVFRARGRRLTLAAFPLTSRRAARRALRALAHGRTHRGVVVRRAKSRRARTVTVLVTAGRAIGAVRLRAGRRAARGAAVAARAYAAQLAARIERMLAESAWQRTLDGIRPNGSITPRLALRAFSIAYGPLPGVRMPRGARRERVPSGTLAMQFVARVWSRLSAAQQRAIDRALGVPHGGGKAAVAHASAQQVLTPDHSYQAMADHYASIYRSLLPGAPNPTIKVFKASLDEKDKEGGYPYMDAVPLNAEGGWNVGTPSYCRVRVFPLGSVQSPAFIGLLMAHETFHCFQFELMSAWRQRSAWVMEGMADWAANTVDRVPAAVGAGNYKLYLKNPIDHLFASAYDAVGFWGRADEAGGAGSLWSKIPQVLAAPDNATSYAIATVGGSHPFAETWAAPWWRFGAAGAAWSQSEPFWIPSSKLAPPGLPITTGTTLGSNPYSFSQFAMTKDPSRPLVSVVGEQGKLRAGTGDTDFGPVEGAKWFCFGKCECPRNEASSIPPHETVGKSRLALALTGGDGYGKARVTYHSLDSYCKKEKEGEESEPTGKSHLVASGPVQATGTEPGYCALSGEWLNCGFAMFTPSGQRFELEVQNFHYQGPGSYPKEAANTGNVNFTDNLGAWWTTEWAAAETDPGGYVINADQRSGSVAATMNDGIEGTGTQETVQGTFTFSLEVLPGS